MPIETFPVLDDLPGIAACFLGRIPGIDVAVERHEAVERLLPYQRQLLAKQGLDEYPLTTAEQVHGSEIAVVTKAETSPVPGIDGLITTTRGITLGIHVADCAPVWVVARDGSAGGLFHSGRKGTELGIVSAGIRILCSLTTLTPKDLVIVIGPCIRPPCYEVDFAAAIRSQAHAAGVSEIHDQEICTACHPQLYYSYRREKGLTGRMFATLTLLPSQQTV